jgi:AcrR family transcriptional regulator
LSKTTLYHYFERKEQILGMIVVATIRELNEVIAQTVAGPLAPDEKLVAFMETQAEFFERRRTQFKVLLTQFGSLNDPQTRDAAVAWRVRYENSIRRIVQEGVDKGVFTAEQPNAVLRAVLSSLYWLVRWYRPNGAKPARVLAREYAQLLLHGVAVRPAPSPAAPGEA